MKIESTVLSNELDVKGQGKEGFMDDPYMFYLNNWIVQDIISEIWNMEKE